MISSGGCGMIVVSVYLSFIICGTEIGIIR